MDETLNMKGYFIFLPYKTREIVNIIHVCITTCFEKFSSSTNLHVSTLKMANIKGHTNTLA